MWIIKLKGKYSCQWASYLTRFKQGLIEYVIINWYGMKKW